MPMIVLGARLERALLSERDFKSLSCKGLDSDNPPLYSSDTVNSGQQASAKDAAFATQFATYPPDLYADGNAFLVWRWLW